MTANGSLKIEHIWLKKGQFVEIETMKTAIVLHHTAGRGKAENVISWWNSTKSREGTHYIIEKSGRIVQCIDEKFYAFHLGTRFSNNVQLNAQSIGIELVNWGWIKDGKSYLGIKVPEAHILDLGFDWRGYRYFESYSDAQLDSAMRLIEAISKKWNISLKNDYSVDSWFEVNQRAKSGQGGLWTHASYRSDKTDCSPQPHLIARLEQFN